MKRVTRVKEVLLVAIAAASMVSYTSCSKDEDAIVLNGESHSQLRAREGRELGSYWLQSFTDVITFEDATAAVMASDKYGNNLYSATAPAGGQVKRGYSAKVANSTTYVQFPINYIPQEWIDGQPLRYEYWNGGSAISNFTNTEQGDYMNQCSVYGNGGHSGSKFGVCYGYSDFFNDHSHTYYKCTKIYLTDSVGYGVANEGVDPVVTGTAKVGKFNSVWVSNTTYAYKVMRDGNQFTNGSLQSQNGWFKVVFRAMGADGKPIRDRDTVSYYLANFDSTRVSASGLDNEIRTGWHQVDLTRLGDNIYGLIVDFEGSDSGTYGLNTPAYVAIDDLSVTAYE